VEMVKFEVDVAFDDEEFIDVLVRLGRDVPEAAVRIVKLVGSGGGWPVLEVRIPRESVRKFAEWYCADDVEFWEEALAETAAWI